MKDLFLIQNVPAYLKVEEVLNEVLKEMRRLALISKKERVILELSCVSKTKIKALNLKFRKKNKPTDILSFESGTENQPKGMRILGELVFCLEVLKKQAKEQKHSNEVEMTILLVHGLLHLLGFDHERSVKDEKKMKQLEEQVLSKIFKDSKSIRSGLILRSTV